MKNHLKLAYWVGYALNQVSYRNQTFQVYKKKKKAKIDCWSWKFYK